MCTLLHFHLLVVDVVDSRVGAAAGAASARRTTTRPSFLFVYLFMYSV